MPTTTVVFKLIPGDEIYHEPMKDSLVQTNPVFSNHGIATSNKISDTMDIENSLRTVVRTWPSVSAATEFVASLQAEHTTTSDSASFPGRLISAQVDPE